MALFAKTPFLPEFMGQVRPKFSIRPLFVTRFAPTLFLEGMCQRITALGYNAMILENWDIATYRAFQNHGIMLIGKGSLNLPRDAVYATCSGMALLQKEGADLKTLKELIVEEMQELEQGGVPLFYEVRNRKEFQAVVDRASAQTHIVFPAAASFMEDELGPSEIWSTLAGRESTIETPLLPLINMGGLRLGEALWPTLHIDLLRNYIPRMKRHNFVGAAMLTPHIPEEGSLLEGNLFMASQALWRDAPFDLTAECWLSAQGEKTPLSFFEKNRQLALQLSRLRAFAEKKAPLDPKEARVLADLTYAMILEVQKDKKSMFFVRDAKRILFVFLKSFGITLPGFLGEEDQLDSYWTYMNEGKVFFRETPSLALK